jgi:uncharacterized phage protein (TIGR02220 family)
MAYRIIQPTFWTDAKVVDDFTPEDKYFMLYCLTNEHTNIIGCYEVSKKQMSNGTGYNKDTIDRLIERLQNTHEVLEYDNKTKEMFVSNWHKYNWTKSPKLDSAILKQLEKVKSEKFRLDLIDLYNNRDTVCIPYAYHRDTTVTVTVSTTVTDIVNYLNEILGTKYNASANSTKTPIQARLNEGYKLEDFKKVIDKKYNEWLDTEWAKFLRPSTLFGNKFEGYLNQKSGKKVKTTLSQEESKAFGGK